jgi:hypothetical protein
MDALLSPIQDDLGVEDSPWSAWSPWERAHNWFDAGGLPLSGVWQSFRTKTHTHRFRVTEQTQKCIAMCPPGYGPANGGCAGPPQVFTDSSGHTYTNTTHASKVHYAHTESAPPRIVETRWIETEWRFTFGSELNPALLASVQHAPQKRGGQPLANLIHGDQLALGDALRDRDVRINGKKHDPSTPLLLSELPLGDNFLDLDLGEGDEGAWLQLHFGVSPPIELLPEEPIVEVRPIEERNGDDITFRISNRSLSEHAVRLDATDAPLGWIAMLLGDRVRTLDAGGEDKVVLRVEQMNPTTGESELLPFSICATLLDGANLKRTAVVYLRPV